MGIPLAYGYEKIFSKLCNQKSGVSHFIYYETSNKILSTWRGVCLPRFGKRRRKISLQPRLARNSLYVTDNSKI